MKNHLTSLRFVWGGLHQLSPIATFEALVLIQHRRNLVLWQGPFARKFWSLFTGSQKEKTFCTTESRKSQPVCSMRYNDVWTLQKVTNWLFTRWTRGVICHDKRVQIWNQVHSSWVTNGCQINYLVNSVIAGSGPVAIPDRCDRNILDNRNQ